MLAVANMHCSECKNLERLWHLNNSLTVYYFLCSVFVLLLEL